MRYIYFAVFLMALVSCNELQREDSFSNYQPDEENYVTNDNLKNGLSDNNYNEMHIDPEEIADFKELYQGFYEVWDVDQDEVLSEKEWAYGTAHYLKDFRAKKYGYFENWDLDSDDEVEIEEFVSALADTPYYTDWDQDGDNKLDRNEFGSGSFNINDEDRKKPVSQEEFEAWSPDYEM